MKDDKMPSVFALGVVNMVGIPPTLPVTSGSTTTSWAWSVSSMRATSPHTMKTWSPTPSSVERAGIREWLEIVVLGISVPFLQLSSHYCQHGIPHSVLTISHWVNMPQLVSFYAGHWASVLPLQMFQSSLNNLVSFHPILSDFGTTSIVINVTLIKVTSIIE